MNFADDLIAGARPTHDAELIYVFLPEALDPLGRGANAGLQAGGLGWISGGGALLGHERTDGTRPIESCGIDIDTYELDEARAFLRKRLPELGCPAGTRLQYRETEDQPRQDVFDGETWTLDDVRTDMHPGFGI